MFYLVELDFHMDLKLSEVVFERMNITLRNPWTREGGIMLKADFVCLGGPQNLQLMNARIYGKA